MSQQQESDEAGQVSESAALPDEPATAVSDSQGVAGNPEAPDADEVEAGPNANPHRDDDTH